MSSEILFTVLPIGGVPMYFPQSSAQEIQHVLQTVLDRKYEISETTDRKYNWIQQMQSFDKTRIINALLHESPDSHSRKYPTHSKFSSVSHLNFPFPKKTKRGRCAHRRARFHPPLWQVGKQVYCSACQGCHPRSTPCEEHTSSLPRASLSLTSHKG